MADRRHNSSPRGWRHFLYAFGPWAVGVAVVLFSILVVAYENRYRSAVRSEIENRFIYAQETAARDAAGRLRDNLGDMISRLQMLAGLTETPDSPRVPWNVLEETACRDTGQAYCQSISVVGADYENNPASCRVLRHENLAAVSSLDETGAAPDDAASLPHERDEIVAQLTQYRTGSTRAWLLSGLVTAENGRIGQVLTVPIRDSCGNLQGLVAAVVPTAFEIARMERSLPEDSPKLWLLAGPGELVGERVAPPPTVSELGPILASGQTTTAQSEDRVITAVPVTIGDATPWTLLATQPRQAFHDHVQEEVGSPWTRRLLVTVACGNFLGLVVLLTLRHWREQITVLRAQAEHDPLTNAYSRRFLDHEAATLCRRVERLGVLMVDLNDFKHHNDTLGHQVGDRLLKVAAEVMMSATRENDFVVRYGGDEFLLLMPLADDRLVASVESRIRWAVEQWNLAKPITDAQLSFAIGAAAGLSRHLDYLIRQADERMYIDKQRYKDSLQPPAAAYAATRPV